MESACCQQDNMKPFNFAPKNFSETLLENNSDADRPWVSDHVDPSPDNGDILSEQDNFEFLINEEEIDLVFGEEETNPVSDPSIETESDVLAAQFWRRVNEEILTQHPLVQDMDRPSSSGSSTETSFASNLENEAFLLDHDYDNPASHVIGADVRLGPLPRWRRYRNFLQRFENANSLSLDALSLEGPEINNILFRPRY